MDNYIIIFIFIFVIFLGTLLFLLSSKRVKLNKKKTKKTIQRIKDTRSQDPSHSLLNSHKLFVAAISRTDNKKTTAAEKIKNIVSLLPNEKKIWYFHRLRNQAAHEIDFNISKAKANEAREQFIRALKALI